MDLKTIKVRTLGKECDAVKVTAYNAFDVAKWCGGTLTKMHIQPGEPVVVEIDVPESPGYSLPYELDETHTAEELDREIDKAIILDAGR